MSIRLEHVSKSYKSGHDAAVDDVSLEVRDGEFMVLVGPSGCGKSTLLKLIAGIEETSAGHIFIGDRDVTLLDPRKRDIAMVFQNYALYPHLTVRANLGFGLKLRKTAKPEIARRVDDVARILGLDEMMERKPGELSGGQRQRVAMGRAIVREPAAFLMDEPLSNLDAKLRVSMRAQLSRLHERLGVTTVYVTHDQVEAMTLGQRVAVMRGGVLQQCDTPDQLFDHPANLFVAAFIGSPAMNLVEAEVDERSGDERSARECEARFGSCAIPLPEGSALRAGAGRPIVLGIRPHDLKLGGAPGIPGRVLVVERLGTETHLVVGIDAPRLRSRALADAIDSSPDDDILLAEDDRATFTVVAEARVSAEVGDRVELGLNPARLHGFDAETGEALNASATERSAVAA
jgi:multiple sugar transport system ATP-binding protein